MKLLCISPGLKVDIGQMTVRWNTWSNRVKFPQDNQTGFTQVYASIYPDTHTYTRLYETIITGFACTICLAKRWLQYLAVFFFVFVFKLVFLLLYVFVFPSLFTLFNIFCFYFSFDLSSFFLFLNCSFLLLSLFVKHTFSVFLSFSFLCFRLCELFCLFVS